MEGIHLVVQSRGGQITAHRTLPGGSTPGRTPAVGHDHSEPLVGEPLGGQELSTCPLDPLPVGSAVGVEQHREAGAIVSVRHQHGGPQGSVPDHVEGGLWPHHRLLGMAGDHMATRQHNHRGALQGGRRDHDHATPDRD